MTRPLIYHTISEQIADRLRNDILSGKLKSGEPLREKAVAASFGVSRGPIREVFRQLSQQGLLITEPNKGVRVARQPRPETRPMVIELRRTIESFVLNAVFEQISAEQLARFQSILADIKLACEAGDPSSLVEHDLRFHRAIIECYEEDDLVTLWQPIVLRMLIDYQRLGDLMESYHEHKDILDAICNGDKAKALAALTANIL